MAQPDRGATPTGQRVHKSRIKVLLGAQRHGKVGLTATRLLSAVGFENESKLTAVPHAQQHRGAHPEDRQLFTLAAVRVLRIACEESAWLLERGYGVKSVLDVVSRRHQLHSRQRLALQRSMCSTSAGRSRIEKELSVREVQGRVLEIDGFNLVIGLEVALSGGLLLRGLDGAIRDLAGLRGSYHAVEETSKALELLGNVFRELSIERAHFYLDSPVSNSGRLKTQIGESAANWSVPIEVTLVANPDRVLQQRECVVSSDSLVLDTSVSWFNVLKYVVDTRLKDVWFVELGGVETSR